MENKYKVYDTLCKYYSETLKDGKWSEIFNMEDIRKHIINKDLVGIESRFTYDELETELLKLNALTHNENVYISYFKIILK